MGFGAGDFLWIAREILPLGSSAVPHEIVLEWVVERKRMDDLSQSIMDGRFEEQKYRFCRSAVCHHDVADGVCWLWKSVAWLSADSGWDIVLSEYWFKFIADR